MKSIVKKIIYTVSLVIILLFGVLLLQSCFFNRGGGDLPYEEEENQIYFDCSNLNYSVIEDKSYTIFDDVDLNGISFDRHKIQADTVIFEIFLEEEKQTTLLASPQNKFSTFRVTQKGTYTVQITAKNSIGKVVNEQFDFEVKTNNRPNNVRFVIKDSEGRIVEEAKGGGEYTFVAEVYADDTLAEPISFFWDRPENEGKREYKQVIGNKVTTTERHYNFNCFVNNNSGEKINIMNYVLEKTYIERDNLEKTTEYPEGIYYSYGMDIVDSKTSLYLNVAESANKKYFYESLVAWYQFDNGDTLPLEIKQERKENNLTLMISYDNEEYAIYSANQYDYSYDKYGNRITNYVANGVKYQFDPTKTQASIQLIIWQIVKRDNVSRYEQFVIESSTVEVDILSTPTQSLAINTVSGSHKDDSELYKKGYKSFTKSITGDSFEVYVCCDMNGDNSVQNECRPTYLEDAKQYFVVNVLALTGSMWDYTLTYSYEFNIKPIVLNTYPKFTSNDLDHYFVCPNQGEATITIKSRFGDFSRTLTVNVVDKLFYDETEIERDSIQDCGVYHKLDVRETIRFKEYYLSSYSKSNYALRKIREGEVLEYLVNGTIIDPLNLNYSDNGLWGQEITVRLKGSTKTSAVLHHIYIIPDFAFSINGKEFVLGDATSYSFYHSIYTSRLDYETEKAIHGGIPVIEYEKSEGEIITRQSFEFLLDYANNQLEGYSNNSENPRYVAHTNLKCDLFTVTYIFEYKEKLSPKNHYYEVEILQVRII